MITCTVSFHALSIFGAQIYSSEFTFPTSEFVNKQFHQNVKIECQKKDDNFWIEYISKGKIICTFINFECRRFWHVIALIYVNVSRAKFFFIIIFSVTDSEDLYNGIYIKHGRQSDQ